MSEVEERTLLQKQGDKIRAELVKAGEKFQNIPQVKAAMDAYDAQLAKLRAALDSDMAKKIFELIEKAKEAVYAAIAKAQESPIGVKVSEKIAEVQNNANAKVEEIRSKVPFLQAH